MLSITKYDHIIYLHEKDALHAPAMHYLTTEFEQLQTALHHDDHKPFSLDAHGYQIAVLEPDDNYRCLPIVGPSGSRFDLLDSYPEYVEFTALSDRLSMYRVCYIFDNEHCLLLYILNDTLEPKLERWLAEQAGHLTGEELQ